MLTGPTREDVIFVRCAQMQRVPRTNWTRRVPHPVLIGHAASAQVGEVSGPVSTPSGVHIIKRLE